VAIKTTEELLEAVQEAYLAALTAQELGTENGRVVKARLEVLSQQMEVLRDRLRREQGTGGASINQAVLRRDT
jgi:hypothetical protein